MLNRSCGSAAETADDDDLLHQLELAMRDGIVELDCGCVVEPDGRCPCGNASPLLALGLI